MSNSSTAAASALLAAFDKKALKHIPGAVKSVVYDIENPDLKAYLKDRPEILTEAITFLARSEFIAQISGGGLHPALDLLIKTRIAHIERVFIEDVLAKKGAVFKEKFLATDEPEETFEALMRDVTTASKEVVRLARKKRWAH